jgi:hypothetical protein
VTAHAYVRPASAHSAEDQRLAIQAYFDANLAGLGYELVFHQEANSANVPLRSRPVGFQMGLALDVGDLVLIDQGFVAFADVADFLGTCRGWTARKVRILILDPGLDLDPACPEDCEVLLHYIGLTERLRHERACERAALVTALKRARGKLVSRHAPPGFKIVGPRRRRRLVPDTKLRTA